MLLIHCPHCGPRSLAEFTFERPIASIVTLDESPYAAMRRLYTRDNLRGLSWELWRHAYGCRAWLKLHRNTGTHEIARTILFETRE